MHVFVNELFGMGIDDEYSHKIVIILILNAVEVGWIISFASLARCALQTVVLDESLIRGTHDRAGNLIQGASQHFLTLSFTHTGFSV